MVFGESDLIRGGTTVVPLTQSKLSFFNLQFFQEIKKKISKERLWM
jgi:hypothetical protein